MSASRITLRQADILEKPIIATMLQRYLREMLEYIGAEIRPGPQPYPYLDDYWTDAGIGEGRVPFLILSDDAIAGFAFRNAHSRLGYRESTSNVAEFFIAPEYRHQGTGRRAAYALFDCFPGRWEVAQLERNVRAQHFWRTVIHTYINGDFEEHDFVDGSRNWIIDVFIAPESRM